MNFTIACSSRSFGADLSGAAAFASQEGFEGIEYNLDFARLPIAPQALARMERFMSGGPPFRFHAPCADVELGHADPEIRDSSLRYLQLYLRSISALGGREVTVHLASRSIDTTELSLSGAEDALHSLVVYGEGLGVVVCLENLKHGWTADPELFNRLLRQSGACATFDLGHARASACVKTGTLTCAQFARAIEAPIMNAHVYEIETPEGRHEAPADLTNLAGALDTLLELGCNWFVAELPTRQETQAAGELLRRYRGAY